MIRLLKSAAGALWAGLLGLVILAGVLSAAAHVVAPLLGSLRDDVAHHLGQLLRAPVQIERLAVRWRGLGPELVATKVAVLDMGGKAGLEVGEITVALSLGDAVRHGRLMPTRIGIAGVRLRLLRHSDGALAIEGLRAAPTDPVDEETGRGHLTALLAPERLRITDAEIVLEDRMRGRPPIVFRNGTLLVRNDGARHQINAALQLPDAAGTRVNFAADLQAEPDRLEDWQAEIYLDAAGAQIAPLVTAFLPAHYRLDQATADIRLWARWERGEPVWAEGRTTLANVQLRGREPARTLRLDRLSGRFRWDRQPEGWLVRTADVVVGPGPVPTAGAEWALAWRRADSQPAGLRIRASELEASDVAAVLALRPPGGPLLDRILQATPGGHLADLDVAAVQRRDGDWWWSASGSLREGRIEPVGGAPRMSGVGLRFEATPERGKLVLDTRTASAELPGILRAPLAVDRLEGELAWRSRADGGWTVEAPRLSATNSDISTRARFRLDLPANGRAAIDLDGEFRDGVITRVPAYLPVGIMKPDAIEWLDRAFQGGTLTAGHAVIRGPLADFPFDEKRTGQFEVTADIASMDLDFAPGWPRLDDVDANFRFHGDSLEVKARRGRMYDSQVQQANAWIDSLSREAPVRVQGMVAGPLANVLRVLRESPLGVDFGEVTEGVQVEGGSSLSLDLSIAIDGVGKDRARGTLSLEDARITHPALPLPLAAVRGSIGFDQAGVNATGIALRLGEVPVTIDLATAKDGGTLITARTAKADLATLTPLLPAKPAWVKGAATFTANLSLPPPGRPGAAGLRLESDLAGLAIDLPPPLAKPAEARRALDVEINLADKASVPVRLRYGPDIDLAVLADRKSGGITRGELRLGGEKAQLPDVGVLRLRGRSPSVDLPAITDWLRTHPERLDLPLDVAITADRLALGTGLALSGLQLTAQQGRAGWQGELRSAELEGRFSWPAAAPAGTATIDLQRLDLRFADTGRQPAALPDDTSRQDPRELPGLVVNIGRLRMNGRDLGNLHAKVTRIDRGLEMTELVIDGQAGHLAASGAWLQEPKGPATQFRYRFETPDFGDIVLALGFADMIDRGPATLTGEQSWTGAPYDFARGRGSGSLVLKMGAGRFIDVEPGVGRLMGLLNITALQRRLTLDFRDLFQKGLGFDTVTGHFDIHDGSLYTQDLTIKSPSSLIEISGRTGILARDYDQVVSVTPSLQSALPIAGTVVGGPAVGAAMLVVQGLVGKQVDKIGRVRYSVRGSWDDPKVDVIEKRAVSGPTGPAPASEPKPGPPTPAADAADGRPTTDRPKAADMAPAPAPAPKTPVPAFH